MEQNNHPEITKPLYEFPTADLLLDYTEEKSHSKSKIVTLKEVILSDRFQDFQYDLPIALGKNANDETIVADLSRLPHLLIAGSPGMGKRPCINGIIVSLLYKKRPEELKFVFVDTRKAEYSDYRCFSSHYLAKLPNVDNPIIDSIGDAVNTLESLRREMENRYDLLRKASARNIKYYNAKYSEGKLPATKGHRHLPYLVVVIDDLRDLILTAGRSVELPIACLAQLSRAVGIHLILSTERPSFDVLTGAIKANFPARIAFRVHTKEESKAILNCSDAALLSGNGDMLFSIEGNNLVRIQGAFIGSSEVESVTRYIAAQQGFSQPYILPQCKIEPSKAFHTDPENIDPGFAEAATIVVESQLGSTSFLQRKMKIGYNRAGRIMDQLEEFGIVGPYNASEGREVKVKTTEELSDVFKELGLILG